MLIKELHILFDLQFLEDFISISNKLVKLSVFLTPPSNFEIVSFLKYLESNHSSKNLQFWEVVKHSYNGPTTLILSFSFKAKEPTFNLDGL